MIDEQILQLLRNGQVPIKAIVIGENIIQDARALISPLELGNNPAIICDKNTDVALGNNLATVLGCEKIILGGNVKANDERLHEIRLRSENNSGLIAVGSGTISDLCKYASHLDNKNYCVFGSALSMNGYSSANATIENKDGYKKSFPAHLPKGIFLDTEILAQSPKNLTAAGFADTICRSTVQSDWLLSHLLLGTQYDSTPFDWIMDLEENLIKNAIWLGKGDQNATNDLANALILSGLGMYVCGGSYPASQGEHLIAHTMEMVHGRTMKPSLHGEQIAVTMLTMAKLQEFMLQEKPVIAPKEISERGVLSYFGEGLGHHVLEEMKKKHMSQKKADEINEMVDKEWDTIRFKISSVQVPHSNLKKALELVGAPTRPQDIGWNTDTYRTIVKHALLVRDRFTFLDLAYYSGKLDQFLNSF